MFTLRCTQKLLKRMRLTVADLHGVITPERTTALGDWYANLLLIQRQQLVMLVNDRSRLCILTTARDMDRLRPRFEHALMELLRSIDVPEEALVRESKAMEHMCLGLTTGASDGRSVVGSMTEYTVCLKSFELTERSLHDWNLCLSRQLCGALEYARPTDLARRLLRGQRSTDTS